MAQSKDEAPQPNDAPDDTADAPAQDEVVVHLMNAVERISTILATIQGSVPSLHSIGGHLNALAGYVTAARNALNPPVEIPPKE